MDINILPHYRTMSELKVAEKNKLN